MSRLTDHELAVREALAGMIEDHTPSWVEYAPVETMYWCDCGWRGAVATHHLVQILAAAVVRSLSLAYQHGMIAVDDDDTATMWAAALAALKGAERG